MFSANVLEIETTVPVGNLFNPPITARVFRIHPAGLFGRGSLRMELYGCYESELLYCLCTNILAYA